MSSYMPTVLAWFHVRAPVIFINGSEVGLFVLKSKCLIKWCRQVVPKLVSRRMLTLSQYNPSFSTMVSAFRCFPCDSFMDSRCIWLLCPCSLFPPKWRLTGIGVPELFLVIPSDFRMDLDRLSLHWCFARDLSMYSDCLMLSQSIFIK